jgi:hypothetical protein
MNRWASVQRQKASPTAARTKSPLGIFHQEGPTRCGALTRAANTTSTTRKMERHAIPAALSRGETERGGMAESGAHLKRTHSGDMPPVDGGRPLHRSHPVPIRLAKNLANEAYMDLTATWDSRKEHCRITLSGGSRACTVVTCASRPNPMPPESCLHDAGSGSRFTQSPTCDLLVVPP